MTYDELPPKQLEIIGYKYFQELSDKLTPTQTLEICAIIAACTGFAAKGEEVAKNPDDALDLMLAKAKIKMQELMDDFAKETRRGVN